MNALLPCALGILAGLALLGWAVSDLWRSGRRWDAVALSLAAWVILLLALLGPVR